MNIRYLKIFLAVVDHKTMNAAARNLHIAQPSISQAIMEMEHYYGVKLFDRLSKHLYLTPTGSQLLSYARYIVSTFDDMEVFLKNSARNPLLRIGSTAVFSTCFLSSITRDMQEQFPETALNIIVTNTPTVERKLLTSELDLGIIEGEINHPDLICSHLATDNLLFICGRSHPFYQKTIQFEDLDGQSFVSREDTSYLRNRFDRMAKERGITYHETWKCSGSEAIKAAVIDGHGIAVISASMVQEELTSGSLYAIPISDLTFTREMLLVYHRNKFFYPTLNSFIDICQNYMKNLVDKEASSHHCILP